jgi:hypothetical protein
MADAAAHVETVSDDEQDEDNDDSSFGQIISKKRKACGAAAHKCLKRTEGKRVRLTNEQKAEISVYAAHNVQLSREDYVVCCNVLLCCNATGSHKIDPPVIGKAVRRTAFGLQKGGWEPKTIVNCWRETGILPAEDVVMVELASEQSSSGNVMAELAALLTAFAADAIPDLMDAQEFLEVDGDVLLKQQLWRTVQHLRRAQRKKSRLHQQ